MKHLFTLLLAVSFFGGVFGFSGDVWAQTTCGTGGTCKNTCISGTENPTPNHPSCTTPGQTTCCEPASGSGGTTTTTSGGSGGADIKNPLEFSTVEEVVGAVLNGLQGIVITLAIVFLVIGAILYLTSGGSEERTTMAKKAVLASIIGLTIGIAAPSFLREISIILEWNSSSEQVNDAIRITEILLNILSFLLGVFGTLAIIIFVASGIRYLFSGGSETQIDTAKRMMTWAIVGVVVAFGALVIVRQIGQFFLA